MVRRNSPHLLYQQLNKSHYAHNTLPCSLLSIYTKLAKVGAVVTDGSSLFTVCGRRDYIHMHNFLYVAVYAKVVAITWEYKTIKLCTCWILHWYSFSIVLYKTSSKDFYEVIFVSVVRECYDVNDMTRIWLNFRGDLTRYVKIIKSLLKSCLFSWCSIREKDC